MTEKNDAAEARIRIEAARKHLTDALEAISGPDPDWPRCSTFIDMAGDVMPIIRSDER
jgi:hypothetical protein